MKPFKKILVPVDFSVHSDQAVRVAADLARRYEGSLEIIHVYEPVAYAWPEGYGLTTSAQVRELVARFDGQLAAAQALAVEHGGVEVKRRVLQGPTALQICAEAEREGVDLIVMGTQGLRGLSHLLVGSVAERVLRLAPCPVLTVKAPQAAAHSEK